MIYNKFFFLGLIFILILIYLFVFNTNFANQNISTLNLLGMDRCFKDGQIPCRWVVDMGYRYGYPFFNYHPPLAYYFGELLLLLFKDLMFSVKILFVLSFVGAYFFTYIFVSKIRNDIWASLFAICYAIFALLIQLLFSSEGLGLSLGLMFFPLGLYGLYKLNTLSNMQNFIFLAIYHSLLILSSNMFPILLISFIIWMIYLYNRNKKITFFSFSVGSIFVGFLLAAFYFIPSILERDLIHNVSSLSPFYLLPKSVKDIPPKKEEDYQVLTGDSTVHSFQKGTNWFKFEIDAKTHTIIRLSQFYFPEWKIFVDSKETNVEYTNNSLGLMTIILGEGNHIVEGRLFDTHIRSVSNVISLATVLILIFFLAIQIKKVKNWLIYYRKRIN